MFRFYLKKLLRCPAMAVSVLVLLLAMIGSVMPFPSSYPLYLFQYATDIGFTLYFMPVVTVIPICFVQHGLQQKNSQQCVLFRGTTVRYALGGMFAACISGAIIMAAAVVLFLLFCCVALPGPVSFEISLWVHPFLDGQSPALNYLFCGAVFCLNGFLWPAIAFAAFTATNNQYFCAALPLLSRFLMSMFAQSIEQYWLDPGQLLINGCAATYYPGGGIPFVFLYIAAVLVICGIFSIVRLNRRIQHG